MDEPSAVELRSNGAEQVVAVNAYMGLWYGHCKKVGMSAKYCGEFASRLRPMPDRNNTAAVAVRSTNLVIVRLCFITNREEPKRY